MCSACIEIHFVTGCTVQYGIFSCPSSLERLSQLYIATVLCFIQLFFFFIVLPYITSFQLMQDVRKDLTSLKLFRNTSSIFLFLHTILYLQGFLHKTLKTRNAKKKILFSRTVAKLWNETPCSLTEA